MPEIRLSGGEADGLALHYTVDGPGSPRAPAAVLIHGLGGSAAAWAGTQAALAPDVTTYALDLPGFGRSAKPHAPYGLGYFSAALGGFVRALALERVALVGHSLGAAVALATAVAKPRQVERLVLLGALVPGVPYAPSPVYQWLATPVLGEALALLGCRPLYRVSLRRCLAAPDDALVERLLDSDYAERTSWAARLAFLATLRGVGRELAGREQLWRQRLRELEVPALLVHGRGDRMVPPRHCGDAARLFSRAAVLWLDRCGHFPQLEHPTAVHAWLRAFLLGRPVAP